MNLITGAAIAACEKIINKALDYDPATRLALAKLEGKILAVKISVPPCKCFVFFQQDSLRLMSSRNELQSSSSCQVSTITTKVMSTHLT